MKLTSGIVLLLQSLGLFCKSGINGVSKQNPLLHWSLVVRLHPWCLFGKLTSPSTSAVNCFSVLLFGFIGLFCCIIDFLVTSPISLP